MNARFFLRFVGLCLCLVAVLGGCAKVDREAPSPSGIAAPGATTTATQTDRARIVTVSMSVRVVKLSDASDATRRDVLAVGGYIEGSNLNAGEDEGATMDLRVPAERVDAMRASLRAMGHVSSESESVQDVTEQVADIGARLDAARTEEKRLLDIMQNRTGSIGDVIEAERALAAAREKVEKLEAEQRTMASKVDMATIHLSLTTPSSSAAQTPGQSVSRAWHAGVRGAQALSVYAAMAVAALAPTLVPLLSLLALVIVLVRRARAKKIAAMLAQ